MQHCLLNVILALTLILSVIFQFINTLVLIVSLKIAMQACHVSEQFQHRSLADPEGHGPEMSNKIFLFCKNRF